MSGAERSEPNRCAARRKDGQACGAVAVTSEYCFAHDPGRATERSAARRRGGRNSSRVVRLRGLIPPRLSPVFDELEATLGGVRDGRLTPQQGQAMASLARAMVAVLQAGELEERVRALEHEASA